MVIQHVAWHQPNAASARSVGGTVTACCSGHGGSKGVVVHLRKGINIFGTTTTCRRGLCHLKRRSVAGLVQSIRLGKSGSGAMTPLCDAAMEEKWFEVVLCVTAVAVLGDLSSPRHLHTGI